MTKKNQNNKNQSSHNNHKDKVDKNVQNYQNDPNSQANSGFKAKYATAHLEGQEVMHIVIHEKGVFVVFYDGKTARKVEVDLTDPPYTCAAIHSTDLIAICSPTKAIALLFSQTKFIPIASFECERPTALFLPHPLALIVVSSSSWLRFFIICHNRFNPVDVANQHSFSLLPSRSADQLSSLAQPAANAESTHSDSSSGNSWQHRSFSFVRTWEETQKNLKLGLHRLESVEKFSEAKTTRKPAPIPIAKNLKKMRIPKTLSQLECFTMEQDDQEDPNIITDDVNLIKNAQYLSLIKSTPIYSIKRLFDGTILAATEHTLFRVQIQKEMLLQPFHPTHPYLFFTSLSLCLFKVVEARINHNPLDFDIFRGPHDPETFVFPHNSLFHPLFDSVCKFIPNRWNALDLPGIRFLLSYILSASSFTFSMTNKNTNDDPNKNNKNESQPEKSVQFSPAQTPACEKNPKNESVSLRTQVPFFGLWALKSREQRFLCELLNFDSVEFLLDSALPLWASDSLILKEAAEKLVTKVQPQPNEVDIYLLVCTVVGKRILASKIATANAKERLGTTLMKSGSEMQIPDMKRRLEKSAYAAQTKHLYELAALFFILRGMYEQAVIVLREKPMLALFVARVLNLEKWQEQITDSEKSAGEMSDFYYLWWNNKKEEALECFARKDLPISETLSLEAHRYMILQSFNAEHRDLLLNLQLCPHLAAMFVEGVKFSSSLSRENQTTNVDQTPTNYQNSSDFDPNDSRDSKESTETNEQNPKDSQNQGSAKLLGGISSTLFAEEGEEEMTPTASKSMSFDFGGTSGWVDDDFSDEEESDSESDSDSEGESKSDNSVSHSKGKEKVGLGNEESSSSIEKEEEKITSHKSETFETQKTELFQSNFGDSFKQPPFESVENTQITVRSQEYACRLLAKLFNGNPSSKTIPFLLEIAQWLLSQKKGKPVAIAILFSICLTSSCGKWLAPLLVTEDVSMLELICKQMANLKPSRKPDLLSRISACEVTDSDRQLALFVALDQLGRHIFSEKTPLSYAHPRTFSNQDLNQNPSKNTNQNFNQNFNQNPSKTLNQNFNKNSSQNADQTKSQDADDGEFKQVIAFLHHRHRLMMKSLKCFEFSDPSMMTDIASLGIDCESLSKLEQAKMLGVWVTAMQDPFISPFFIDSIFKCSNTYKVKLQAGSAPIYAIAIDPLNNQCVALATGNASTTGFSQEKNVVYITQENLDGVLMNDLHDELKDGDWDVILDSSPQITANPRESKKKSPMTQTGEDLCLPLPSFQMKRSISSSGGLQCEFKDLFFPEAPFSAALTPALLAHAVVPQIYESSHAINTDDRALRMWNWRQKVGVKAPRTLKCVAAHPYASKYLAGDGKGRIHLCDFASDSHHWTIKYTDEAISQIQFNTRGDRFVCSSVQGSVIVSDFETAASFNTEPLAAVDWMNADCQVAVCDQRQGYIYDFLAGNKPVAVFSLGDHHNAKESVQNTWNGFGNASDWGSASASESGSGFGSSFEGYNRGIAPIAVFGPQIAIGSESGVVKLFDIRMGRQIGQLPLHEKAVTAIKYDPSGLFFVSGSEDNSLCIVDRHMSRIETIPNVFKDVQRKGIVSIATSNQAIVAGGYSSVLRVWTVTEPQF